MGEAALAAHAEGVERMMSKKKAELEALAPDLEAYAKSLAVVPPGSYVRILLNGESRIVTTLNVPSGFGEQSWFFDSSDPSIAGNGRALLKTHHPEPLGTYKEFCLAPARRKYFDAVLKHGPIDDGVVVVRAIDYMERTQMPADATSVAQALEAVRRIPPLPQRRPEDFLENDHARP
jgi:hypothetical protein